MGLPPMTNPVPPERVLAALEPYGLVNPRLQLLSDVDCLVYRVTASSIAATTSASAILKIYPAYKKDPANIEAEVEWLQALKWGTPLRVPAPLQAKDESIIQSLSIGLA